MTTAQGLTELPILGLKASPVFYWCSELPRPLLSHRLCQSSQEKGCTAGIHHPNLLDTVSQSCSLACSWHRWIQIPGLAAFFSLFLFSLSLILADHVPEAEVTRGFSAWSGVFQAFMAAAQVSQGTQSQLSMAVCFTPTTRILPR